ncbi:MuDRA-like transposase [Cucumis melo var. makuwa]|uniref:MuDRA-like transposase n=1 Tax=Cucumis melo var. makuwa TaxID=1194695 RepID=A0A5A7V467_CUCMM|nr:MuDRA-like transposase [Cucumis melo var. makuwa]
MAHVRILVRHGGAWDEGRRKYEGGVLKGIVVPKEIAHKDLQSELYDLAEVNPTKFDIKIRCIYEIKGEKEAPPFELSNDRDLKFYILSENPLEVPLYLSFEPTSNRSMKMLNKDYNSVSGSNQVQNLNPHPPIGIDTLDENEVDIGEVQSVEMYNELFDIPEQRDAPTKDCRGKGKVDYSSSSRKLKTKGSGWSEESSTKAWRHLLAFPNGSGKYLNDVGIARWSRVHCPGRWYNMMTTNIAESMNSILKEPRDLPIASFLENVRALLQRWFWERREEGIKVTSTLTKWAELVIQKKQEGALTMKVNPIDCYQFHVKDLDKEEVVNLQTKECTCKEFQAEQLPCSHAIAAARDSNINVYSLCANYYTNECLLAAYAEAVYPVGNQSDWKTSEDYVHMTVLPPKVVKRVG